ncbi:vWA domain-containing protein [Namhaeicola litoreus]|uniref:VWA domain-containing protein n=1 Tax=Namhaeicola litoreus TaxID=1052145 RepID=A0ABW3XZB0_9FLAO
MKNYTDITILLDRSGSMETIKKATIKAFNSFLLEQNQANIQAKLSLIQFDDQYEVLYTAENIKNAKKLSRKNFEPRGTTALFDAIGILIGQTTARLQQTKPKPNKVLIVILTDGQENASREFSEKQIKKQITALEKQQNWHFIYLAANQDAIVEGAKFGIEQKKVLTFEASDRGVSEVLFQMSSAIKESANSEYFDLKKKN